MGSGTVGGYYVPWVPPSHSETITRETETSSRSGGGNIPQAQVGIPVAAVLGQKRVTDANTIWTGNLRPLLSTTTTTTETKETDSGGLTTTTTTTTTTTAVVGYLVDIHMGICLGPDVHLLAMYVDNILIYSGDIGPARTEFTVPENDTFLSGASCVFSGGAYDQAPEPDIDVVDYPGYVGTATLLMKNVRADLPMGALSFEVYRTPNPLSLSAANNVSGHDLNVASAIVEVMTNPWGWGGLDISDIDTTKFATMAATLKTEGNFCSIKVGDTVSIAAVLKTLSQQGGMLLFQHPETALITGNLVRNNIAFNDINHRFGSSNIINVQNYSKTWWNDTVDQGRGTYLDRANNYQETPVFVQNGANLSQSGRGRKTLDAPYPYCHNATLALNLISRDLAYSSIPIYAYDITTNRDGAIILPGETVFIDWRDFSLLNNPMIVTNVRKQPIDLNTVTITVQQAKLGNITALYGAGGAGAVVDFDTKPKKPLDVDFITAPYFFARAAFGITSAQVSPVVYPVILPRPANDIQFSFSALVENMPSAVGDTLIIQDALYPTYAQLDSAIDIYDAFTTGKLASVTLKNVVNPINLQRDIGADGVTAGQLFVIIDNEILSFESVTDNGDGTYTLTNVYRSLLDTVVATHAANADVYIIGNNFNCIGAGMPYPLGFTPDWVITSNAITARGLKADGLSSDDWAPSANRTLSPPRPHNAKIGGVRSSTATAITEGASVTVTWATRSRTRQTVALQTDAADTAEGDQKHRVFHRSSGGTLTDLSGLVSGNTATFTMPDVANGAGDFFVRAEITLGANVYTSIGQDRLPVTVS